MDTKNQLLPQHMGYRVPLQDDLLKILKPAEASLISHLINLILSIKEEWVEYRTETIKQHLKLSRNTQDWIIKKLKKYGILHTKTEGFPARRFAAINFFILDQVLRQKSVTQYSEHAYLNCGESLCQTSCTNDGLLRRNCASILYMPFSYSEKGGVPEVKALPVLIPLKPPTTTPTQAGPVKDSMPFNIKTIEIPVNKDKDDTARIKKLKDNSRKLGFPYIGRSQDKWEIPFRLLRRSLSPKHEIIDAVLDWFCSFPSRQALQDAKLPTGVCNGHLFRKNWEWIFSKYEKHLSSIPTQIEITEPVKQMLKRLRVYKWPKGSLDQLPAAVQVSVNRMMAFQNKISEIKQAGGAGHDWNRLKFVLDTYLSLTKTYSYIEKWFQETNKRIVNWEQWSGSLEAYVWRADHERFQNYGQGVSVTISGNPHLWNLLYKRVVNED